MKIVTDLNTIELKNFLLRSDSYCSIDLPPYLNFSELLKETSKLVTQSNLKNYYKSTPTNFENVNYSFMTNKDGVLSWRQFQIIHPVIYVSLVNLVCEKRNWDIIKKHFAQKTSISCLSLPVVSLRKKRSKADQINSWWHNVEQKSLSLALEYDFVFHTDITNFYPSIYTHSLAWALHGKEKIKKTLHDKKSKNILGNDIDYLLMSMNYGQTNGIPQGSVLMDLISEILLKEIDIRLEEEIENAKIGKIEILRYRDDYRIFTNDKATGYQILQIISKVLAGYGLSLNKFKTTNSSSVILSSLKEDKIAFLDRASTFKNLQKQLLSIYFFSEKHPNSGSLMKLLSEFYEVTEKDNLKRENIPVLISIIAELMFKNPKATNVCTGILSKFLDSMKKKSDKKIIINKILKKSSKYPFTGMVQIWIQRITIGLGLDNHFDENICKSIKDNDCLIWNNDWLNIKLKNKLEKMTFLDEKKLEKLQKIIPKDEFDVFSSY